MREPLVRRRVLPWIAAFTMASGVATGAAIAGPANASDHGCSQYTWPDYSAACMTSEDGRGATITVRRISTNSSPDADVTIVVARGSAQESLPIDLNPAWIVPKVTVSAPGVGPDHDFSQGVHQETVHPAVVAHEQVKVVIWRAGRATTFLVREAGGE